MMSRFCFGGFAALFSLVALSLAAPAWGCSGALHLEVGPSGVYHLNYADAVAAQPGLADCPLDELRLRSHGKEVPIRIVGGDGDGSTFSEGDAIEWVGQQLHGQESWFNPYTHANAYTLDAAAGKRLRYRPREAAPGWTKKAGLAHARHLERDHFMMRLKGTQVAPGQEPDVWYWAKLTMANPKPFSTSFNLPGMQRDFANPLLTLAFRGWSQIKAPDGKKKPLDHRVNVQLNGKKIASLSWDGEAHVTRTLALPRDLLRAEDNKLVLTIPKRKPKWAKHRLVDVVMFDYLDIHYPLATPAGRLPHQLRVSHAGAPDLKPHTSPVLFGSDGNLYLPTIKDGKPHYASILANTTLFPLSAKHPPLTPTGLRAVADQHDWHNPGHGYDYIIIAHPSLMEAIEPLAEFHRQRGLKTAVINVDAAYDQFNHGVGGPMGIRNLLDWAWHKWPGDKPQYVLLVGDASFDPHDKLRAQKYYASWTDRFKLLPGRFTFPPGTPYKNVPDAANARNLVPTFRFFGQEGQSASDNKFVAVQDGSIQPVMAIGRFPVVTAEAVAGIVQKTIRYASNPHPGAWRQRVMFITNDQKSFQNQSNELAKEVTKRGFTPVKIYPDASDKSNEAHTQKISQDLNDGQLLVHFMGHGGRYIWRTGPPDPVKNADLFTIDDVAELSNDGRMPMVISMTCFSAPFDNPVENSIGEEFLREADGGAIAVFAASWRNVPDPGFSDNLINYLLQPGEPIGDAVLQAKRDSANPVMLNMYNLLGDPAIPLQRPQKQMQITQLRNRWKPGIMVRIPGTASFHGTLHVQWLDEDDQLLVDRSYTIDAPQFRLPKVPEGAKRVRLYAADPSSDTDALGELTLTPPPEPETKRPWWKPAPKPVPLPPAEDRVFGTNFGG